MAALPASHFLSVSIYMVKWLAEQLKNRIMKVKVCYFVLSFLLQQQCTDSIGTNFADSFTSLGKNLLTYPEETVELPSAEIQFTEWIFPNSLTFQCSGEVSGWLFRTATNLSNFNMLPQFNIYRENMLTSNINTDYSVMLRSGSSEELREFQLMPGIYLYLLNSPVNVERGDILGINYPHFDGVQLPLLFSESVGDGAVSYMRQSTSESEVFDITDSVVQTDRTFTPLVTILTADDTEILFTDLPTIVLETAQTPLSSPTVTTDDGPETSMPGSPETSTQDSIPDKTIGGIIAGALLFLVLIVAVSVILVLLLLKRRQCKEEEYEGKDISEDMKVSKNCAYAVTPVSTNIYQKEIALTLNTAYVKTPNISMQTNECYGTTADKDSGPLYATPTTEGETSISFQYDYVIPQ